MDRCIWYQADETSQGLTVRRFLQGKGFSRQDLIRLKNQASSIQRGGADLRLNQKLEAGDEIAVRIREMDECASILPVHIPLKILYEDEDLVAVDKPAGMPVHPSYANRDNTLANALTWYYQEKGEKFIFRCCNRLDRDTSGVVLVSKNVISASILSEMGVRREIGREYLAIARGKLPAPWGTIDIPIGRKPGSIIERTVDPLHGEEAVTHYQLVAERKGYSLVLLRLETGRTHQIRIHMKYLGTPLAGDYLYNPDMEKIGRQALHSFRITLRHPVQGKELTITCPMPADMAKIIS